MRRKPIVENISDLEQFEKEDREIARKDSWQILPMPELTEDLKYNAEFSTDNFAKMSRGFIPSVMEEKWFIYCEEATLHFHRSWTGICIFQLELIEQDGKYQVKRAVANRDEEQCGAGALDLGEDEE